MTDIDAIRARHTRWDDGDCAECPAGTPWPCDTARETARADKAEAALWLRDEAIVVLHEQRHAARADADRLAAALGTMLTYSEHDLMATLEADAEARAALAAHREAAEP